MLVSSAPRLCLLRLVHRARLLHTAQGSQGLKVQRGLPLAPKAPPARPPATHAFTHPAVEFQELELGKVLGEGSFGAVCLAKYCQTTGGQGAPSHVLRDAAAERGP